MKKLSWKNANKYFKVILSESKTYYKDSNLYSRLKNENSI